MDLLIDLDYRPHFNNTAKNHNSKRSLLINETKRDHKQNGDLCSTMLCSQVCDVFIIIHPIALVRRDAVE